MKRFLTTFALLLACLSMSPARAQSANTNITVTPFAGYVISAASTINGNEQFNDNWAGCILYVTVSGFTAGTVTVNVQGKDPVSGTWVTVLGSTALAANGTTTLTIHPGLTTAANAAANALLPRIWRVQLVGATTPSMTVSVAGYLQQ